MKPKLIKEGELFCLGDRLFTYSINESGGVVIRPETDNSYKPTKAKVTFTPPTLDEVKAYFKEKGYREDLAVTFFEGYENGNPPWHDSRGNPVKAWKQKAIQVWFKPDAKIKDGKPEPTKVNNFYQKND